MDKIIELMEKVRKNIKPHRSVGVAISGGLDSAVILHEICRKNENVHTYTVRWKEDCLEGDTAKKLSGKYVTTHNEILFNPQELINTIDVFMFQFDRPRWNLWPLWIVKKCGKDGIKDLYLGEGCDEILGYTDRSYLQGWISQLEYILPVWKRSGELCGVNIHTPFLEVELNNGIPNTLPYCLGKDELWKLYKDYLKSEVIYPKQPALHYYEILREKFGWKDVKKELMRRVCLAWVNTQ